MSDTPIPHTPLYTPIPFASAVRESRSFQFGAHVIRVTRVTRRTWAAWVDETLCGTDHPSPAVAWEAGVRELDRIERAKGDA